MRGKGKGTNDRTALKERCAFTTRALLALTNDFRELAESTERVRLQVNALATEHGVPVVIRVPS